MSVAIRVENTLKTKICNAQDLIQSKFGVKFQKQNQSFPHINLISGEVADVGQVYNLIDSISLPDPQLVSSIGLGCFLTPSPTVFVRYEASKNILSIRNQLFKNIKFWTSIDYTVNEKIWIPKTTIACNDVEVFDLSKICTELTVLDFSSNFRLEALVALEYSTNQVEIVHKTCNFMTT